MGAMAASDMVTSNSYLVNSRSKDGFHPGHRRGRRGGVCPDIPGPSFRFRSDIVLRGGLSALPLHPLLSHQPKTIDRRVGHRPPNVYTPRHLQTGPPLPIPHTITHHTTQNPSHTLPAPCDTSSVGARMPNCRKREISGLSSCLAGALGRIRHRLTTSCRHPLQTKWYRRSLRADSQSRFCSSCRPPASLA